MSDSEAAVGILYGLDVHNEPYKNVLGVHPYDEEHYPLLDSMRKYLDAEGIQMHVLMAQDLPREGDHKPHITRLTDPHFRRGRLVNDDSEWQPSDLAHYDLVVDKWVGQFRFAPDLNHPHLQVAQGLGIDEAKILNPKSIKQYGNNKDAVHDDILGPSDIAIPTYKPNEYDVLQEIWGSIPVIAKPVSGALSQNLHRFATAAEAIGANLGAEFRIQPLLDMTLPIRGLKPLVASHKNTLRTLNNDRRRLKEVRFVTAAYYDELHQLQVTYNPILRVSPPGEADMNNGSWFPIDPDSMRHDPYDSGYNMHDKVVEAVARLMKVTGAMQAHICTDVIDAALPNGIRIQKALEMNVRGAHVSPLNNRAWKAKRAMWKTTALRNARQLAT